MRITLVISSLSCGGAERVMSTIANYWAQRGEDVTLITLHPLDHDFYTLHTRVDRVVLDLARDSKSLWESIKSNYLRLRELRATAKTSRPDVIISFLDRTNVLTLVATRGLKVPVIASDRVDPRQLPAGGVWNFLRRQTYSWAGAVVVQSVELIDVLADIVPTRQLRVIPNPAPQAEVFSDKKAALEFPSPFVSAMGRLNTQKGFDILLDAFARCRHKTWSLVILGEGPERRRLESLSEELGINYRVYFPGIISEPSAVLRRADLFVLSSRYEGFPNALIEAMSCGRAVIAFDCPTGPNDIIRHEVNGILVPLEDSEALTAEMDRLMEDKNERERLGKEAQLVSKQYSIEKVIRLWDETIFELLHC